MRLGSVGDIELLGHAVRRESESRLVAANDLVEGVGVEGLVHERHGMAGGEGAEIAHDGAGRLRAATCTGPGADA